MNEVSFIGELGGDGECFRWGKVPRVQRAGIVDTDDFDLQEGLRVDIIYPSSIFRFLKCEWDKKYRFTIKIEEMASEANNE